MPIFSHVILYKFAPSVCGSSPWPFEVVWPPESRAVGPSIVFASSYVPGPSKFSLECVDVGVLKLGSLADGAACDLSNQPVVEYSSFHGSLGSLNLLSVSFS